MQNELHAILAKSGRRHAEQGDVVTTSPQGLPFNAVIHAVAVDGFYKSSRMVITQVVEKALRAAASLDAKTVALAALATGYGRLTMNEFAAGIQPLLNEEFEPVRETIICVRHDFEWDELQQALHR